jgi:hypothetical protein
MEAPSACLPKTLFLTHLAVRRYVSCPTLNVLVQLDPSSITIYIIVRAGNDVVGLQFSLKRPLPKQKLEPELIFEVRH